MASNHDDQRPQVNSSEHDRDSPEQLGRRIDAKLVENLRRIEENPDEPQASMESMVMNLLEVIKSARLEEEDMDLSAVPKSTKSGQYKFAKAKNFQTTFKDGRVLPGIHGISMHAVDPAYKGPKCYNCGKMHDLRKCGRCKKIWYCDRECQSFDWPRHKLECNPPDN